ncbi:MAG: hypothetical protein AB7D46_00815 [Flavobacteriaceae bacterium]
MSKKGFILNDERVENSHGFFVLNSGGRFDRFNDNPVMLSDHKNENDYVIGKWVNLKQEPYLLVADPSFDKNSERGKKVQQQVDGEFVKGASLGLIPYRFEIINDKLWLVDWEMVEGSIVPIPSNKKSLAIYNEKKELLSDDQVKQMCLSIREVTPNTNVNFKSNMKKIQLTLAALIALGFTDADKDGVEESVLNEKVLGLSKQNETLKQQNDALIAERDAERQKIALSAVDTAIAQGKITADKKETFLSLFKTNPELAKQTLDAIPVKTDLAGKIIPPTGGAVIKSLDDFQKLSLQEQLDFKTNQPEEYKKLFN